MLRTAGLSLADCSVIARCTATLNHHTLPWRSSALCRFSNTTCALTLPQANASSLLATPRVHSRVHSRPHAHGHNSLSLGFATLDVYSPMRSPKNIATPCCLVRLHCSCARACSSIRTPESYSFARLVSLCSSLSCSPRFSFTRA